MKRKKSNFLMGILSTFTVYILPGKREKTLWFLAFHTKTSPPLRAFVLGLSEPVSRTQSPKKSFAIASNKILPFLFSSFTTEASVLPLLFLCVRLPYIVNGGVPFSHSTTHPRQRIPGNDIARIQHLEQMRNSNAAPRKNYEAFAIRKSAS